MESNAAIVTGGATGIGLACARRLLERRFDVLICSRTQANVSAAVESLNSADSDGRRVVGVAADVADPATPDGLVSECVSEFGRLDALVNCAGIYAEAPFLDLTAEAWDETLNTNLRARSVVERRRGPADGALADRWPHRAHRVAERSCRRAQHGPLWLL